MGSTRSKLALAKASVREIKQRIKDARQKKEHLEKYLDKLHKAYANRQITHEFYVETLHVYRDGKNIHGWINHYENYIRECEEILKKHQKTIAKRHALAFFVSALFFFFVFMFFFDIKFSLTGFVTGEQTQQIQEQEEFGKVIANQDVVLNVDTKQHLAVVGQPVKWTKKIYLDKPSNITLQIPSEAENITVKKSSIEAESNSEEITEEVFQNKTSASQEKPLPFSEEASFSITGKVVSEIKQGNQENKKNIFSRFSKNVARLTGLAIQEQASQIENQTVQEVKINENSTFYEIEYETPAPEISFEQNTERGKRIKISSPENIHYENVRAFTNLPESFNIKNPSQVKIYWHENNSYITPSNVADKNGNGIFERVEFIIPSLSEQTFEIIVITKAEHLNSSREFISDIYPEVRELDDFWSEPISSNEYVRVTFEANLTSDRDISIYPRTVSGNPKIEVYEIDENNLIATFENINSSQYNKILLTNLSGSQDVFDLKIVGGSVEIDHIIDPHLGTLTISGTTELCGSYNNVWDKIVVTNTGVLNICAFNGTAETGFVNITLGTAGNFTVYPGGLINGTARGGKGGAATSSTTANATQGDNGNNWTAGTTSTFANGGGGGGGFRNNAGGSASGGGGGFGGAGGTGGFQTAGSVGGEAGLIYGQTDNLTLHSGSGGGGASSDGGGAGGAGGAGFKVNAGLGIINIKGFINVSGFNGVAASGQDQGAGGGGSGGHVILYASNITIDGAIINASGGSGGSTAGGADDCYGAGGGGGRIYVVYSTITNASTTTHVLGGGTNVVGCSTDPTAGTAGTIRHNQTAATFTDNAPQWVVGSQSVNDSTIEVGESVMHRIQWTDDGELDFAILEVNGTGASCDTTANVTSIDSTTFNGNSAWSNLTWEIPSACAGKTIGWRIYAKDWPKNQTNVTALQMYQVAAANTAPTISLNYPPNNANLSASNIIFSAIPVDGEDASGLNVSIYGNWSGGWHLNVSNTSSLNNTQTNFSISGISDGKYIWNARVFDSGGLSAFAPSNFTFTKDTAAPTITLPFYANGTIKKNTETLTLNISVSDALTSPSACNIDINGTNQTVTVSNGWCNITNGFLTNLGDGNRTINVYANDSVGNWGLNNSFVVTVDSSSPIVALPFYVNGTIKKNTDTLTLNISVSDSTTSPSACVVNINGTNQTVTANNNWCNITNGFLTGLTNGNQTIFVWANDTANNFALNSSFVVKMDSTSPTITLPFYVNGTKKTSTSDTLTLNISVSDSDTNPSACKVDINGTNQTYSVSNGWCNITDGYLTNLADGNRTINVYANDSANNFGVNNSFVVFVDANSPVAEMGTNVADNNNRTNRSATFDLRAFDGIFVDDLALYGNWTGSWIANQTNISPINATYWNVTVDAIPEGKWRWAAWANDSHNNFAFSTTNRTFTVDLSAPTITLPFYVNGTIKSNTETLTLNVSVIDALTNPSACNIDANGTNFTVAFSSGWCNTTLVPLTNLGEGNQTINVYANDSAGNWGLNNSFVVKIVNNVAPTIPFVQAISAQDPFESGTRNVVFNFSVNDTNGAADINISSVRAQFNQTGEATRANTSCMNISTGGNGIMFTCTIGMFYFDNSGTWTINVSARDNSEASAENSTTNFTYNLLTAMVISPSALSWPSPINLQDANISSNNDPITINNTGNAFNLTINVTAYNLRGETDTSKFIFANNFTIGNVTDGCGAGINASIMQNATSLKINGTNLSRGNNSLLFGNETSGQEQLFFCLRGVPQDVTQQSYSSSFYGPWEIKILLVALIPARRKKNKKRQPNNGLEKEEDKLLGALDLIIDKIKEDSGLKNKEITGKIIERIMQRYKISKKEISELMGEKINIPSSIFSKELGALETLVKYMKENLRMNYSEISKALSRDERTIWTAYKKATQKKKNEIEVTDTGILIPLSVFENSSLTVLESTINYLKEKGLNFREIADILERDQRNVWTIYSRLKKKITDNK